MAGGRIFINYRRDDSRADAGRIYDRLSVRYPGAVFRDVGSLEPGVEWRDAIEKVLSASDACVVVIGKTWLSMPDAAGRRRLDNPLDTVRLEIFAALQHNMRVIPVLVGGAAMPDEDELPEPLRALARRNALQISEQDWDEDLNKLVRALDLALGLRPQAEKPKRERAEVSAKVSLFHGRFVFAFTGVLAMGLIVGGLVSYNRSRQPGVTASNQAAQPAASPPLPQAGSSSPAVAASRPASDRDSNSAAESRAERSLASNAPAKDENLSPAKRSVATERVAAPPRINVASAPSDANAARPPGDANSARPPYSPNAARDAAVAPNPGIASSPPPVAPALSGFSLAGIWQLAVTSPGQRLDEQGHLFDDGSFLVLYLGNVAALGNWRYNTAKRQIEILNAGNFLNYGVRFACVLPGVDTEGNSFGGNCLDAQRNNWSVAMTRDRTTRLKETRPIIPGLDLSSLSLAQSWMFSGMLEREACTCGCGLNLLACRRSQTERCALSLNIARQRLQQFFYNVRR